MVEIADFKSKVARFHSYLKSFLWIWKGDLSKSGSFSKMMFYPVVDPRLAFLVWGKVFTGGYWARRHLSERIVIRLCC
jgi:hypothetical protein